MADLSVDMTGKFCVVTGCTSGIGLETAFGLLRMGASVCLAAIDEHEGQRARVVLERRLAERGRRAATPPLVLPVDLRSAESMAAFAERLAAVLDARGARIDVLVNCAGLAGAVAPMFAVNVLGTAALTRLLRPLMRAGGRVVFAASDSHQIGHIARDDFDLRRRWGGLSPSPASFVAVQRAYATTKLTLICWAVEQASRDPGVRYYLAQPGCVDTAIGNENAAGVSLLLVKAMKRFFFKTPWQGAQTLLHCATSPACQDSGRAWANNAPWRYWNAQIDDPSVRAFVWSRIETLLGEKN